ncbi:isochorismatase family protein [Rhodococcus koreensis]
MSAVPAVPEFAPYSPEAFGRRTGIGRRPAVLVVDLVRGFTDPQSPCGTDLDDVVAHTRTLLDRARTLSLPVIFTTIAFAADAIEGSVWVAKMPAIDCLIEDSPATAVDPRLGRRPDEPIVSKRAPSAFSGTGITTLLTTLGVDSLVVTGAVTSGCIRASVVDSVSAGYRTIVPRECVGDRHAAAHAANLFDIDAKYADVLPLAETLELLTAEIAATA